MARARNIKPAFWTNDELAEASIPARLFFISLWSIADCMGNLEWRPRKVKTMTLPYDDVDVQELANDLDKNGFVRFYSEGEVNYLNIIKFWKHQTPHPNEKKKGPVVPEYSEERAQAFESKRVAISHDKDVTAQAVSCSLIPDTCSLIVDTSETKSKKVLKVKRVEYDEDYERIWLKRPTRAGGNTKAKAFKAFNARLKAGATIEELEAGMDRYYRHQEAAKELDTRFTMQLATFFGSDEHYLEPWTITANTKPRLKAGDNSESVAEAIAMSDDPFAAYNESQHDKTVIEGELE